MPRLARPWFGDWWWWCLERGGFRLEDRTRVHVFVNGDLEGTGFTQAIADKANEQSVAGWVKELSDGRIEAVLQGAARRRLQGRRAGAGRGRGEPTSRASRSDREPPRNEKACRSP